MQNNFGMMMQMIANSGNPKACVLNMLKQNSGNNPMIENVLNMMSAGNEKGVEAFARNMCKEKGIDPEELYRNVSKFIR